MLDRLSILNGIATHGIAMQWAAPIMERYSSPTSAGYLRQEVRRVPLAAR
jgi:hypothetical protein